MSKISVKHAIIILILMFLLPFAVRAAEEVTEVELPSFDRLMTFVDSNRYSHQKSLDLATNQQTLFEDATEITTEAGIMYVDEESLAFQVVNENGYIWSSTIDYNQEGFAESFKNRARSALIVESFNTTNTNYAITEENVFQANTDIDFDVIANGFHATITFGRSKIQVGLEVTYTLDGIKVRVPQDEIDESGTFKISTIKVYPYFGAVKEADIPGYVFVPDGIGALIDYKLTDPLIAANYQKEIYDRSLGYNMIQDLSTFISGGTRIYAPVFGFVHGVNQNAVFAHITEGDAYGMINVYYPARTRGYTTIFSEFVYRKTYSQPIDNVGTTISLLQMEPNEVNVEIMYTLLEDEDANYVGMAKAYRDQLDLQEVASSKTNIPLHLETIGLEKKKGVLFTETIVMTTLSEMLDIVKGLNASGINHIQLSIDGFTSNGVTWSAPQYEKMSRKLGNNSDLVALSDAVDDLYLVTEYMKASTESSGFNAYFDLAKKINDQLYVFNSATDTKHLLEHSKVSSMINKSFDRLNTYSHTGLLIGSMGNLLYEDYANGSNLMDQIELMKTKLSDYDRKIALEDANSYMWDVMDTYYQFPMYTSQYVTFDDTVPFLSIALSGTMDLFGPFANFYPYAKDELLRLIDFGVYPSFIVTHESSKLLLETGLESIYASRYEDIKHAIVRYYDFVNQALSPVMGETIESREVLSVGVVKVMYSSGTAIVVNYLEVPYTYLGQTIDAKGYHVFI